MTKVEKAKKIIKILNEKFGKPHCALNYNTDFELLVAVILSAQCTDVRVNMVTEKMFKVVNTPESVMDMPQKELENHIKSTGFFRNKAKNIKMCSKELVEKYGGKVPSQMENLIALPGVGRKTANVVRGEIWGLSDGVTVDTHVKRLSNLIGFVKEENVEKIERELMKIVPKERWIDFSHYLILQGRDVCIARRPKCCICEINHLCNYGRKTMRKIAEKKLNISL
ncbi:endonuclease III [uncultured Ilyobacter sp.]|uniref:endonuclease III n=1 Tax=uncultured Ilyobacter sp. TaxID=544433 RepID=UPI0029C062C7|nr:endonuclease III [uncultured Ilyobacter sp.]